MAEPTFLFCLGATKAGTSWLYRQLQAHPECRFRSVKELHYFTMTRPAHFAAAADKALAERGRLEVARAAAEGPRAASLSRRIEDLADWQAVLARGEADLDAYRAYLTKGAEGRRLVGDVTPAYALMPVGRLKALTKVARDVRVVFLMRDPVARLWSHVRMLAERTAPTRFADEARALLARILAGDRSGAADGILRRGDYAEILPRLARAFDPSRLLVMFSEDMLTPAGFARLQAFLGLTPAPADFAVRVHEGTALALDPADRAAARRFLGAQYAYVAARHAPLPRAWDAGLQGEAA